MTTASQEAMRKALEDARNTVLWMERRLPQGYGEVPHVHRTIASLDATIAALSQQAAQEPQPVIAWMRDNERECITDASKRQMEATDFGCWKEVAASYTIPLTYAAAPAKPQISRAALTEFIDKFCLGKSQLIACAESAFYAFNLSLAGGAKPAEQENA